MVTTPKPAASIYWEERGLPRNDVARCCLKHVLQTAANWNPRRRSGSTPEHQRQRPCSERRHSLEGRRVLWKTVEHAHARSSLQSRQLQDDARRERVRDILISTETAGVSAGYVRGKITTRVEEAPQEVTEHAVKSTPGTVAPLCSKRQHRRPRIARRRPIHAEGRPVRLDVMLLVICFTRLPIPERTADDREQRVSIGALTTAKIGGCLPMPQVSARTQLSAAAKPITLRAVDWWIRQPHRAIPRAD
jgi:hypothetical protein